MAKRRRRNQEWIYIGVIVAVIAVLTLVLGLMGGDKQTTSTSDHEQHDHSHEEYQSQATGEKGNYIAEIKIRDFGTIMLELDSKAAPLTVENFVSLAKDGFYDGLTFHRIMEGFMMQGGDPEGNGFGGSDKTIKGEFSSNGVENNLSHTRGAISMARSEDPDSASSQFFICHKDSLFLDGEYAAFGYVTEGIEVVDAICEAAEPTDNNGTIPASAQPVIESVTVSMIED